MLGFNMKGKIKLFLIITLVSSFVVLPTYVESSTYYLPMCDKFYLSEITGSTSINYHFGFPHFLFFNITIINELNSTSSIIIEKEGGEEHIPFVLQPGGTYNFTEFYPFCAEQVLNEVDYTISLEESNRKSSGIIIYGLPSTNCTITGLYTTNNLSIDNVSIGFSLMIFFTGSLIIVRKRRKF